MNAGKSIELIKVAYNYDAINMTRVIAINPFLFSIATVFTSIQQAVGRYSDRKSVV